MSEELLQRGLLQQAEKFGDWLFYNIGSTNLDALKRHGIIEDIDYRSLGKKKPDAIIVNRKKVYAIIEYKTPQELSTIAQKAKAVAQEQEVAKKLNAKLLIVTDTKQTLWVNPYTGDSIRDEKSNEIRSNFDRTDDRCVKLVERMVSSVTDANSVLKPIEFINPTPLAKQIWQDIWSVSGATPENCLYTFVELFIFKYISDLQILKGYHNFYNLLDMYEEHSHDEVLEFYANNVRPKIKELFPYSPVDKTTIINGTIFVSKDEKAVKGYSTVFKKILERFNDYGKLENIDHDFKSQLFESFLKESISKKNWGQYFTPLRVVKAIVKMSDIKPGDSICDPACGVGKFLLHAIADDLEKYFYVENGELKQKITLTGYDKGFDHDEQKTIILAKANMLIYFSDLIKNYPAMTADFATLFNDSFVLKTNSILGTLAEATYEKYDWILTNPPYVTSGSSNLKEEIRKSGLEYYYSVNASGAEGLFLEWIINALKRDGKAFIVIPDGIFLRDNLRKLRKFIMDECYVDCIISLPTKTFFTTPKMTYILGITKKAKKETIQQDPIFTYLVSEIGESRDVYRFEIPEDHLTDGVNLYNQFKGAKGFFATVDPRCKIIPANLFYDNLDNWMIEKYWSDEEKVSLGIKTEEITIHAKDFVEELEDLKDFIAQTQIELNDLVDDEGGVVEYRQISILDKEYLRLVRGKRITKSTINMHKGAIPVYSSSKDGDSTLGHIDEEFLQKEGLVLSDRPAVLLNLDGSVGKCFIKRDTKYSFIDVVAALEPTSENIDLDYLKLMLEDAIVKTGASYQTKLYFNKIKSLDITIPVPINSKGEFDRETQKTIARKRQDIEVLRKEFSVRFDRLSSVNVSL